MRTVLALLSSQTANDEEIGIESRRRRLPSLAFRGDEVDANRVSTILVGVFILALLLTACGGGDTENTSGDIESTVESREELLRLAEEEGALHVQISPPSDDDVQVLLDGFMEKYPFINATGVHAGGSSGAAQYLLEVEAGAGRDVDVAMIGLETIERAEQYVDSWDVLALVEAGILDIPVEMIDPVTRGIVAQAGTATAVMYNSNLIDEADVPDDWMGFLDERFNRDNLGLVANVESQNPAGLVPGLGEEETYEWAAGIAALDPIWVDSKNTGGQLVVQGEAAVYPMQNAHTGNLIVVEAEANGNPTVAMKYVEPIPIRLTELGGVMEFAEHPHAGLLWLEYVASEEVQAMWDAIGPPQTSPFSPYDSPTSMRALIDSYETSIVDWEHIREYPDWVENIIEASGFPTAQE